MSKEDAFAFLKKVAEDKELMEKVRVAGKKGTTEVARDIGFAVTVDDLKSVIELIKGKSGELLDDDLEMISGGISLGDIENWVVDNIDKLNIFFSLIGDRT